MKASAGYVCDLTSYILENVESLVDFSALGGLDPCVSHLVELAEQTQEDVNYVKQITRLLQDRQSLSATGTHTTSHRETQRWVEDGITSGLDTLLSGATATAPTLATYSPALPAVHENELRLRVRVKDQAFRQMLLQTTDVEGRDRVNLAIQTCPDLRPIRIKSFTQLQSGDVELGLEKAADKEYFMRNQVFWLRGLGAGAYIIRDTYTTVEEFSIGPGESGKFCCAICDGSHPSYSKACPARIRATEATELENKRKPASFFTFPPETSTQIPSELTTTLPATASPETRPSNALGSLSPPAPLGSCLTSGPPAEITAQTKRKRPALADITDITTQPLRKRPALADITAQTVTERYVTGLLDDEAASNIASRSLRKRARDASPCPHDPTQSPPGLFISTRGKKRFPSSQSLWADPVNLTSERKSKRRKTARKLFVDTN